MIVYSTHIHNDIAFPLDLPRNGDTRYNLTLSSRIPSELETSITLGLPFYQAHGRKVYLYSDRVFEGSVPTQPWCYEVKDVVKFYWVGGTRTIFYELGEKGNPDLLSFWFIHLFLPLYFTLEDMYDIFHAGAVEIEGRPVLFIAPSMGGKSTLTDYFIKRGHTLISDDKVPTFVSEGRFMVVGSHPYHRPYRRFEELGYRVKAFAPGINPIHAFYKLEAGKGNAAVTIEEISGYEKFDTLLPSYLYMFQWLVQKRFEYLSNMLNAIRVFRVQVPWKIDRLNEVHDAIWAHNRGIT